jgi:hypothetical protein
LADLINKELSSEPFRSGAKAKLQQAQPLATQRQEEQEIDLEFAYHQLMEKVFGEPLY